MGIKLFVSDIDGTLLESGKEFSAKNLEAVHKMVDAGIIFTVATGRMYLGALPIAKKLGVNVPIITYNGALIKSVEGEVIHSEYIPEDFVVDVMNFFEKKNWYLQNYSNDILYIPFRNEFTDFYENSQKVKAVNVGWNGLREHTSKVCKLLSISNVEDTAEHMSAVNAALGDKIDTTQSHPKFVEITPKGVSKAAAVKILAEKFGVDRSEIMAIGDSDNDLPMLKAAGTSIAMGNAVDAVKKSCDFVTGLCSDDGFAEAVYKYVLK